MTTQPKNLGVKIGTKVEKLWGDVAKEAKILIEQSENNLVIQKELLSLAERRIEEEEKNRKV
jgi:hypothetical protein|tara:strand:- start:334 stop:519 length:186 start_codon:yes stop_codon:yes gene_type:complete